MATLSKFQHRLKAAADMIFGAVQIILTICFHFVFLSFLTGVPTNQLAKAPAPGK